MTANIWKRLRMGKSPLPTWLRLRCLNPIKTISFSAMAPWIWIPSQAYLARIHTTGRLGRYVSKSVSYIGKETLIKHPALETDEPDPRRLPCLHFHNYSRQHHPGIRRHCTRTWSVTATCELSYLAPDRRIGRCTLSVEALVQSVRTSAHLSLVPDTELDLQCGLCEESNIWLDGCV